MIVALGACFSISISNVPSAFTVPVPMTVSPFLMDTDAFGSPLPIAFVELLVKASIVVGAIVLNASIALSILACSASFLGYIRKSAN